MSMRGRRQQHRCKHRVSEPASALTLKAGRAERQQVSRSAADAARKCLEGSCKVHEDASECAQLECTVDLRMRRVCAPACDQTPPDLGRSSRTGRFHCQRHCVNPSVPPVRAARIQSPLQESSLSAQGLRQGPKGCSRSHVPLQGDLQGGLEGAQGVMQAVLLEGVE